MRRVISSEPLQDLAHTVLEELLPAGGEEGVAVFLGVAGVLKLLVRGGVVNVSVGVARDERRLVRPRVAQVVASIYRGSPVSRLGRRSGDALQSAAYTQHRSTSPVIQRACGLHTMRFPQPRSFCPVAVGGGVDWGRPLAS